jgi:hypothetical protein
VVLYTPPLGEDTVKYVAGVIAGAREQTQLPTTTYWVGHLPFHEPTTYRKR